MNSWGQNAVTEFNNGYVRARIMAGGRIGSHPSSGVSGYFVPADILNGASPLYTTGLWLGGTTLGGEQRCSAHLYGGDEDFSTGPLTADGSASLTTETALAYDRFWAVTRDQIELHQLWTDCQQDPECDVESTFPNGYTIPPQITNWPAIGDLTQNQPYYLAPFIDLNNDGNYDPFDGDYPCVPGDQAIYHIFNDHRQEQTDGTPMGIEVHMTVFGYWPTSLGPSPQTLFVRYVLFNRSTETYSNFRIGVFADLDIGCYSDDRIGTDVGRNMVYAYNATNNDVSCSTLGYGTQPPAFGVQILKGPLLYPDGLDNIDTPLIPAFNGTGFNDGVIDNERFGLNASMYYDGTATPGISDPTNETEFLRYLRGIWANSAPLSYGGTGFGGFTNTAFAFPGDSDPNGVGAAGVPQSAWSDATSGDRKGIAIMGPLTLDPGGSQEILLAYNFARATSGGPAGSVAELKSLADQVRTFAENTPGLILPGTPCSSISTNVSAHQVTSDQLLLYPNPTTDRIVILIPKGLEFADMVIEDMRGSVVLQSRTTGGSTTLDLEGLDPGLYTMRITGKGKTASGRFVKQ
jgi:hypothetical protein